MKTSFTLGALHAAKAAQEHIQSINYTYRVEEAAMSIDAALRLPELISLMQGLVEEAKRDLSTSPNWSGPTVRISRSRLKELSNILDSLKG